MNRLIERGLGLLLLVGGCGPEPAQRASEPLAVQGDEPVGWWAQVSDGLRVAGLQPRLVDGGGILVPNPAAGIEARLLPTGGVRVSTRPVGEGPLRTSLADGSIEWRTVRVGREGLSYLAPPHEVRVGACVQDEGIDADGDCLRRAEFRGAGVTEWWVARDGGIEQGWEIDDAPLGDGVVQIEIEVDAGIDVDRDGLGATLTSGSVQLRYDGVVAWDADGQVLAAWMELGDAGLVVAVEVEGAAWPIIVDPLVTTAGWTAEGGQAGAYFGSPVSSAGDVNGDGYGDVVVGAHQFDNGQTDEGSAFLYLGSSSGLSASAALTAESNQASAGFGWSVSSAGDVNGDGCGDVVVGAWTYDNGQGDEGRAFLYLGSASGLSASAPWTVESNQEDAYFGGSVSSAGDVNGDGYGDVVVGAYAYDNGQSNEGRASLYLGSSSGLSASAAWTAESNQAGANFGWSASLAGDVNGDDYGDVVVGAFEYGNGETGEGRAFLYLGSASGLSASAAWTAEPNQANAHFGYSVSLAGDSDGDGHGDVAVGAPNHDNGGSDEGRAFLYLGSSSGLSASPAWTAKRVRNVAMLA